MPKHKNFMHKLKKEVGRAKNNISEALTEAKPGERSIKEKFKTESSRALTHAKIIISGKPEPSTTQFVDKTAREVGRLKEQVSTALTKAKPGKQSIEKKDAEEAAPVQAILFSNQPETNPPADAPVRAPDTPPLPASEAEEEVGADTKAVLFSNQPGLRLSGGISINLIEETNPLADAPVRAADTLPLPASEAEEGAEDWVAIEMKSPR